MHIEILVEDSSGKKLLETLVPKLLGAPGESHTWRFHHYRGVGRIPRGMTGGDPTKRILLDQLPRILQGYGRTPGIDAVIVVLDTDRHDCVAFLDELRQLLRRCNPAPRTLFRLAIEEIESWYLGDRDALISAYPRARIAVLDRYRQDSVCGTWELLADAVYPGGVSAIRKAGGPLPGQVKHEWAEQIGPRLDLDRNVSPSFRKFSSGLRQLTEEIAKSKKGEQ